MRETIEIEPSPAEEDCAQVGQDGYRERAVKECYAFICQIKRAYGIPPAGARLRTKWSSHDFGIYGEVAIDFDVESKGAAEYAYAVEADKKGALKRWDDAARKYLGLDAIDVTAAFRKAARDQYQREGEIEIDDSAIVSDSEDGAYVQAWVWVDRSDLPAEFRKEEEADA